MPTNIALFWALEQILGTHHATTHKKGERLPAPNGITASTPGVETQHDMSASFQ